MTRVRRNNEEKARERERHTCDDQPRSAQLQLRNLRGDEPDAREEDQQEPNFRDSHTSVSRHGNDGVHLSQSAADFGHTHGPRATTRSCHDEGRLAEEWVRTDYRSFLRQLGAEGR